MRGREVGFWVALAIVAGASSSCSSKTDWPATVKSGQGGNGITGSGGSGSGGGADSGADSTGGVGEYMATGTLVDNTSSGALGSAQICVLDVPTACVTTAASGDYSIAVPSTATGIVVSSASYATSIWSLLTTKNLNWAIDLRTSAHVTTMAQSIGSTFDQTAGAVLFHAYDKNGNLLSNVTVAGTLGYVGYLSADNSAITTAGPTTTSGSAFIFGLAPGTVNLVFSAPGLTCARDGNEAWPATAPGAAVSVPVVAGDLSVAWVVCE